MLLNRKCSRGGAIFRGAIVLALVAAIVPCSALAAYVIQGRSEQRTRVEEFDPASHSGPVGKIIVPYPDSRLLTSAESRSRIYTWLRAKDGVALAPVGTLRVLAYMATVVDKNGGKWNVQCSPASAARTIQVREGAEQKLDIGPPYEASIVVTEREKDKVSLDLKITGRGIDRFTFVPQKRASKLPGFKVFDYSGHLLWQGSFRYG